MLATYPLHVVVISPLLASNITGISLGIYSIICCNILYPSAPNCSKNGFPKNFTKYDGVSDIKRAFLMGNALVCGVVEKIGESLFDIHNKY